MLFAIFYDDPILIRTKNSDFSFVWGSILYRIESDQNSPDNH
jgi:hypothetical protein